jgi:hypothetical protein
MASRVIASASAATSAAGVALTARRNHASSIRSFSAKGCSSLGHHRVYASSSSSLSRTVARSTTTGGGFSSVTGATRGSSARARRRATDAVQTLRASDEDDPPSSYEATPSLPAVIADATWFNTYVHGAAFVFILGRA